MPIQSSFTSPVCHLSLLQPSHSAMHSRAVLSVVSEKTFLHLPFCPNLSGGTWPSGQPERHNRNAQVCGEAGHVTRHNRHNRHNGIKSKPNVAPPIVQTATMSPPPSNFHRAGSTCLWQLAHLLLSHSSPVLACSSLTLVLAGSHQGELTLHFTIMLVDSPAGPDLNWSIGFPSISSSREN